MSSASDELRPRGAEERLVNPEVAKAGDESERGVTPLSWRPTTRCRSDP